MPDITSTLNCSTDLNHTEGAHRNPYVTRCSLDLLGPQIDLQYFDFSTILVVFLLADIPK